MIKITPDTTLKDAMVNPMAKDVLEKLMMALRLPSSILESRIMSRLKLKTLTKATAGLLDKKTIQLVCDMFNLEKNEVITDKGELTEKWWKEAKKRNFRALWIQRINAAARLEGMSYSKLMGALHKAGIEINRKVLADLAMNHPEAFKAVVAKAKAA